MFLLGKLLWFVATPSNALALLAGGGVLAATLKRGTTLPLACAAIGVMGLIVCGFSPVGYWLALPLEERFAQPRALPAHVDGIVVLGGAVRVYNSARRDVLGVNAAGDRLLALSDLARRYPSAKLVFSGGSGNLADEGGLESDIVRAHAAELGIDPARIVAEDRSRTTHENAVLTRELVKPGNGETWLLVTSAWHMPRAVGAFRQAGFPVIAYPVDFRTSGPDDKLRFVDEVARGLGLTDLMTKEWIGLIAYRLLGRTDALFPAAS